MNADACYCILTLQCWFLPLSLKISVTDPFSLPKILRIGRADASYLGGTGIENQLVGTLSLESIIEDTP